MCPASLPQPIADVMDLFVWLPILVCLQVRSTLETEQFLVSRLRLEMAAASENSMRLVSEQGAVTGCQTAAQVIS